MDSGIEQFSIVLFSAEDGNFHDSQYIIKTFLPTH